MLGWIREEAVSFMFLFPFAAFMNRVEARFRELLYYQLP
jgi:hypothetical protein